MLLNPSCTSMFLCRIFFFLLKNLLCIFFQHLKDANPLFFGFFHIVSPNKFFFSIFKIFSVCLVFGGYSKVTSAWWHKINSWIRGPFQVQFECKRIQTVSCMLSTSTLPLSFKTDTCQWFCISKKNIPLPEKIILILFSSIFFYIIVWTQIFFMQLFQNKILQQIDFGSLCDNPDTS